MARRYAPSLNKTFLLILFIFLCLPILLLGSLRVIRELQDFNQEAEGLRTIYLESQKTILQDEVDQAIDYVRYNYALTEDLLKQHIKERVYEAYEIVMHLYRTYHETRTPSEIQAMAREALRPIRFNHGRGYYFATNLTGIEELFADRPNLEGKNLLAMQDTHGQYVIRDMIDIVRQNGEGFYQYTWTKPNESEQDFPKIAFVKYVEPFDWLLGTGEYLDDVEADIQHEVLEYLRNLRFGSDGYLFGSTYTGEPLFTNGKITVDTGSVWDLTDPNGVKIIQEQRRAAMQPEGGFVRYVWKKLKNPEPSPKIAFVKGFPEWQWIIGAGVYLDDIEAVIQQKRNALREQIIQTITGMVLIWSLLLLVMSVIANVFAQRIRKNFHTFTTFFHTAATASTNIAEDSVHFEEFREMAVLANRMLDERNKIRDEQRQTNNALRASEEKIRILNADLEQRVRQRTAELEAANRELRDFAYVVSHDLKAPLRGISRLACWLNEDYAEALDEQGKQMTHTLIGRVKRMDGFIDGLLEYSRIGRIDGERVRVDLNRLLPEIVESLAPPFHIAVTIAPDLPVLVSDQTRMVQVFQNLIGNAIKFMDKSEGLITVDVQETDTAWIFQVADNGPGIDPKYHDKIFQIFQTLTPRDVQENIGIGLALVKKNVESYGGKIWVESVPGRGSSFFFTFPRCA